MTKNLAIQKYEIKQNKHHYKILATYLKNEWKSGDYIYISKS